MRDEKESETARRAQPIEQLEDLRRNGRVERGGRLVRDQDRRVRREGHRQKGPLLEAAREPVRVFGQAASRVGESHLAQPFDRDPAGLAAVDVPVSPDRLHDLRSDSHDRIERASGLLEDERDFPTPHAPPLLFARGGDLPAADPDRAGRPGGVRQQADERSRRESLSAAAFPDDRQGFARLEVEAHPVDRGRKATAGGDLDAKVPDLEKRSVIRPFGVSDQWTDSREFL